MADGPWRIGVVGTGRWGRLIVRDLVALGAVVSAVARSQESAAAARAMGASVVVDTLTALADQDGYVVATPEQTHLDIVEALLPRGRPIFVEKPLDVDVARAEALPPEAGGLVFVMHKWRYHPGIQALADIVRDGELGAVRGMMLERTGWGIPQREVSPIWVLAPHDLSIVLHVLGAAPYVESAAPHPLSPPGQGVVALLRTPSRTPVSLNVSAEVPAYRRSIVVACAEGSAQLTDPMADHILFARRGAEIEQRPVSTELPLLRELRAFLEHLTGGPPPMTALQDEIVILRTLASLEQASHKPDGSS